MELAKGQITINYEEIKRRKEKISIKMMSSAIPENISKKNQPKIVKTKFKEDLMKKIETETLIGELQLEILEEIVDFREKEDFLKNSNEKERKTAIFHLFMNIDKISNVKNF